MTAEPLRGGPRVFAALDRALAAAIADEPMLIAARDTWNRLAGKVNDDEPLYEERAAAFLEWYALEYRPAGAGEMPSPVERLISAAGDGDDGPALTALAASHRSVFRVREMGVTGGGLLLDDLWGGGAFRAKERRQLAGVSKGEILDARLVADIDAPPDLLLTRIVCVHPREAEDPIRDLIARARKDGEDRTALLFRLLRLRVRCERYLHVTPIRIYAAGEHAR